MAPALPPDGKIPCPTQRHLVEELDELAFALEPAEKEDTWEKFEKAIIRFAAVVRGGGYKFTETFVEGVGRGGVGTKLVRCMLSDRGRLSGVATDLLQTFAPRLSTHFKPLTHLYLEPIMTLLGRPNKVYLRRTEKCLATIISNCHLPVIVQELRKGLDDNAAACRKGCAVAINRALQEWPYELWNDKWLKVLEGCIKKMGADKDPQVRETGREVLGLFAEAWPERVNEFASPLTPITRRNLKIDANGVTAKPKTRPAAPARKMPPPLTSSTASSSSAHPPAPHHRVQELGGSRFPQAQQPAAPSRIWSGDEPRAGRSTYDPRPPRIHAEPLPLPEVEPARPRALNTLPPVRGRTVSHDSLPTSSSTNPNPNSLFSPVDHPHQSQGVKHNPLSKPVRPPLPASWSTSALLPQGEAANAKPRRMAPPERIVKPVVEEEDEDEAAGSGAGSKAVASGALRGAVRPAVVKKNIMGQATRRVVTAPVPLSSESGLEDQPQQSIKPCPQTSAESFFSPVPSRVLEGEKKSVESPLMPVLMQSTSSKVDAEEIKPSQEESEGVIDMEEDVDPASPSKRGDGEDGRREVEVAREIALPDSPTSERKSAVVEAVGKPTGDERAAAEEAVEPGVETKVVSAVEAAIQPAPEPTSAHEPPIESEPIPPPPTAQPTSNSSLTAKPARPPAAPQAQAKPLSRAPSRPAPAVSGAQPERKAAVAVPRKPPVPRARVASGSKPVVPLVRKAFKPTSAASVGSGGGQASAPAPAPAAGAVKKEAAGAVSKPTVASASARVVSASGTTGNKPPVTTKTLAPPPARPELAKVSRPEEPPKRTVTSAPISKPPASRPPVTSSAPAAKAPIASRPRKPAVPSHVVLPAAKKEKIRLKAPLPSFRPMRAKKEVKPETVPLPDSPPKAAAIPLPPSPHDSPSPRDHPLPPSPPRSPTPRAHTPVLSRPSPLRTEIARGRGGANSPARSVRSVRSQASGRSVPASPGGVVLEKGRPASPLLTKGEGLLFDDVEEKDERAEIAGNDGVKEEGGEQVNKEASEDVDISGSVLGNMEEKVEKARVEESIPQAEVAPTTVKVTEDNSASRSFNTPSIDDIPSSLSPPTATPSARTPSPLSSIIKSPAPAFATRIEVSTPGKSALSLLAKLEGREDVGTPERERKALAVKDANAVGTPKVVGGGGFEGDVSA
ncbi:hypothetical protein I350_03874 [Cryptococcus amylolentus CBS 6273]|uniref:CLASP N-terminal domain-containing protein n=1 Tax=Cryptococcus amylolentus CBS 6273 TaxID=1296118 RepID=A0A1E3K093_9TREE|nr:hypothetical protein I350_03874 [Cryptococcus amylolentus CBS 6273]